jgi:hypothetical protein
VFALMEMHIISFTTIFLWFLLGMILLCWTYLVISRTPSPASSVLPGSAPLDEDIRGAAEQAIVELERFLPMLGMH